MLAPIAMMKAVVDGMIARRFGRIVNITSASVKSPIPTLGLSNGARAGLTGFVGGLARQAARHNVTINNLLPGPFVTDRLRSTMEVVAGNNGRSVEEEMAARAASTIPPAASATRRSSVAPAPSSAPITPATSSGRTCCSTAAPSMPPWGEATRGAGAPPETACLTG